MMCQPHDIQTDILNVDVGYATRNDMLFCAVHALRECRFVRLVLYECNERMCCDPAKLVTF